MTTSSAKRRRLADAQTGDMDSFSGNNICSQYNIVKSDSQEDAWSSTGYYYINPFVHRLSINNRMYMTKVYLLSVFLMPLRVVGCVISLITAWLFACIGLHGMNLQDLKKKPLTGWRRFVQRIVAGAMRMVYAFGSFHYITFKGERASAKEAPILVVAPHSSYVDSIVVVATSPPSIVAKQGTSNIPLLGKIINYSQPIYVVREDPDSRQNTIREIVERARSEQDWPQVVIFAEGTCTNRAALIKFKAGAFYPGVPVQPVLLKYPNKYDTFTWTWNGPGVLHLLWLTMCQFYNHCEIEYLPVYKPSEEEKSDANLYANNVREVMARALNVPTSEYSFEDVIMMSRAKDMRIPFPGDIVEIEYILHNLDYLDFSRDIELAADFLLLSNTDKLDLLTFSELIMIDIKNEYLHELFSLLDHRHVGTVNLKSFLLCSFFCKHKNDEIINFLRMITYIYSASSQRISRESFGKILRHSGKSMTPKKCDQLFFAIDHANNGVITFGDFELYTRPLPQYNFLYKKKEYIRRTFKNK